MSVKLSKKELKIETQNKIKNECFIQGLPNPYGPAEKLRVYGETTQSLYVPFAYYKNKWNITPHKTIDYPSAKYDFYNDKYPFRQDGGRDQKQVYEEAKNTIKNYKTCLLSLHCGYGKTYTAIRLAQTYKLKTAVLAHRGVLFDQWEESIVKFTNAIVQKVGTDGILNSDADFYIFNISYVHKKWDSSIRNWIPKKLGIYKDIGLLIVDEAHIACAADMSRSLLYFNPRVAIALTATPTRKDGMDKALELYFGKYTETRITRIASSPFTVYRFPTDIKPEFTRNSYGRKDWGSVITNLCENPERNKIIIQLVNVYVKEGNTILILTKRKSHCTYLSEQLNNIGISNTTMMGTDKVYNKNSPVLISTYSKLGVGFDDTRLNMLIVACSVTDIEQYAGRLRDGNGKKRIILDLVDNDSNCIGHWRERRKWYISRKGEIYTFPKADLYKDPKTPPKRLARKIT